MLVQEPEGEGAGTERSWGDQATAWVLVGSVAGTLFGLLTLFDGSIDPGVPTVWAIALPGVGGGAAGVVLHALRGLRRRGRLGAYSAWAIGGVVFCTCTLSPELLNGVDLPDVAFIVAFGVLSGLTGLAARQLAGYVR